MILKWQTHEGYWTWRGETKEVIRLGYHDVASINTEDYLVDDLRIIGESSGKPMILRVEYEDGYTELLALHVRTCYLCNKYTGSTVDTIVNHM